VARKRLTQHFVQTVRPPKSGQLEFFDDHPQGGGVGLRVSHGGKKTWFILYRQHGRQRRLSLGDYPAIPLARAREKALAARTTIAEGNDPAGERQAVGHGLTFSEVTDRYLAYMTPQWRPSTATENHRMVKAYLHPLNKRLVRSITREDVEGLFRSMSSRNGKVQANRVLTLLKSIFSYALDEEWVDRNPAVHRRLKPNSEAPRERVLNAAELRAVWRVSADLRVDIRDVVRLLILLGQRIGETLSMKWSDIDLDAAKWTIPASVTKVKRTHVLPLSHSAAAILRTRKGNVLSDYVFPGPDVNAPRSRIRPDIWRRLVEVADAPFAAHDLRRTMATGMPEYCQIPPHVVARLLNHAQTGVTNQVYNHYRYLPEMREALEKWAAFAVAGGQENIVLIRG